jgi:hypothetical protein
MAIIARKGHVAASLFVATQYNLLRQSIATSSSMFHADVTSYPAGDGASAPLSVTAATAADLPTSIALANQLTSYFNVHAADALAHKAADTANAIATPAAADLPTSIALANAIKAKFNAHLVQSGVHCTNDATNTNATAAATDLPTTIALLNAMKGNFNAHFVSCPAGQCIKVVDA